jgi:hypothetical protein
MSDQRKSSPIAPKDVGSRRKILTISAGLIASTLSMHSEMEIIREHQIRFLMCDSFRSCWVFIVFSFIKLRLSRAFSDRLISAMRFRIPLTMLSFLAGGSIMVLELLRIARVLLGTIGFRCWLDRSTDEVRSGLWF